MDDTDTNVGVARLLAELEALSQRLKIATLIADIEHQRVNYSVVRLEYSRSEAVELLAALREASVPLVALKALSQQIKDHQVGESLATRELDALIAAHRPTQAITRKAERQARSEGTAEADVIPPGVLHGSVGASDSMKPTDTRMERPVSVGELCVLIRFGQQSIHIRGPLGLYPRGYDDIVRAVFAALDRHHVLATQHGEAT